MSCMDRKELLNISGLEEKNFWHVSRRDLLGKMLPKKSGTVFEVGAGCGKNLEFLRSLGFEASGIDIDPAAVEFSRKKGLEVSRSSVEGHEFSEKYDLLLMMDVLEHIEKDAECVKKLATGIKKGGHLYLTVPAFNFMYGPHDLLCHHHRRYEIGTVKKIVESAGLSIEKISYWNGTFFLPVAGFKILRRLLFGGDLTKTNPDLGIAPEPANSAIIHALRVENHLIAGGFSVPFGSSVVCLARKVK